MLYEFRVGLIQLGGAMGKQLWFSFIYAAFLINAAFASEGQGERKGNELGNCTFPPGLAAGTIPRPSDTQILHALTEKIKASGETAFLRVVEGKATINPRENDFPYAYNLQDISLKELELVWGVARGCGQSGNLIERTFDLIAINGPEKDIFHIDAKFASDKLTAYRVRGIGISNPVWIEMGESPKALSPPSR